MSDAITNMLRATLYEGGDVGDRVLKARQRSERVIMSESDATVATLCKPMHFLPATPDVWILGAIPNGLEAVLDGEGKPITETMEVLKYL